MTASSRDVRCYSKSGIQGFGFHQKNDNAALAVRFGSLADICSAIRDVRYTPKSGHVRCTSPCPLSAKSGHSQPRSLTARASLARLVRFSVQANFDRSAGGHII